jgi:hypothetical protein
MSVENFVDIIVVMIKITFAAGIIAGVLRIVSVIIKNKNEK